MHRHNDITVVAFYTVDTPYEGEIEALRGDCRYWKLPLETRAYPSKGSWVQNAGIKPSFLLQMLEDLDTDLLYLDADARIRKYPELIHTLDCDVAVHYRRGAELLSGTIYLKNCVETHQLVERWQKAQGAQPNTWDQRLLQQLLPGKWRVEKLPPQYTQIFDSMKHNGDPVIEHMQASRRFKATVNNIKQGSTFPETLGNVRIRRGGDGCVFIARSDKIAERWLDTHCVRQRNQLKWFPKAPALDKLKALEPVFKDKTITIVGKGPSLDRLSKADLGNGPIIALNEAGKQVAKVRGTDNLFVLQGDASLRGSCLVPGTKMLVSIKAAAYYNTPYIYDPRLFGLTLHTLSVTAAVEIGKFLGCKGFRLVAFDACTAKLVGYAKCVGYDSSVGGHARRFLDHKQRILARTGDHPITWVTPKGRA